MSISVAASVVRSTSSRMDSGNSRVFRLARRRSLSIFPQSGFDGDLRLFLFSERQQSDDFRVGRLFVFPLFTETRGVFLVVATILLKGRKTRFFRLRHNSPLQKSVDAIADGLESAIFGKLRQTFTHLRSVNERSIASSTRWHFTPSSNDGL